VAVWRAGVEAWLAVGVEVTVMVMVVVLPPQLASTTIDTSAASAWIKLVMRVPPMSGPHRPRFFQPRAGASNAVDAVYPATRVA
jgi:hypothetical protein